MNPLQNYTTERWIFNKIIQQKDDSSTKPYNRKMNPLQNYTQDEDESFSPLHFPNRPEKTRWVPWAQCYLPRISRVYIERLGSVSPQFVCPLHPISCVYTLFHASISLHFMNLFIVFDVSLIYQVMNIVSVYFYVQFDVSVKIQMPFFFLRFWRPLVFSFH